MPLFGKKGEPISFNRLARRTGSKKIAGAIEREARSRGGSIGAAIKALRATKGRPKPFGKAT